MKTKLISSMAVPIFLLAFVVTMHAQVNNGDIYWHIDPSVKSCSMVIDPSLTQAQWKTFLSQTGPIITFKSLASAEVLGKMHFNIAIEAGHTPVDQRNPAWINTFTHPGTECPLGDAVSYPAIRARMGITDNMDIGAYWTQSPDGNYGMVGGELKCQFLQESEKLPAAAVRGTVSILTGVRDFDVNLYGADLITSKKLGTFSPYIGFRGSMVIGTLTTSKVNLDNESLFIAQGYAGMSFSIWLLSLAAEYDVSDVQTVALAAGVNF